MKFGAWILSPTASDNGRHIKCLTIADDFSHKCVDIAVDHGIGSEYVMRGLEQAARFRGYPQAVRTDQGTEFIDRASMAWRRAALYP